MTSKKINAAEPLDLERLADQIEELIELCGRLQEENDGLRAAQSQLQSSHSRLADKNEFSRERIETMISRLKVLEGEL